MDARSLAQIAEDAGGELTGGEPGRLITHVSTDSRRIAPGELFVALRGENFDAHDFIQQVAETGAAGAMVMRNWSAPVPENFALIRVADPLAGYQQLAARYRASLPLKVIAITGSNGKTSTKDFTAVVFGGRFRVSKTEGNFNNHIGVPRTILDANSAHEIGVWEIGMNHPGEIAPLAKIAAPQAAIITNIGRAHLEYMETREAIAQEKGMLAEAVPAGGTVVLNADDPFSESIAKRTRATVVLAGRDRGDVRAIDIEQTLNGAEFTITAGNERCRARIGVLGSHMVGNALLAVAAGRAFGIPLEECARRLADAPLTTARLQMKRIGDVQFLDDSYNASPESMAAALRTLAEIRQAERRIAVLGHMAELGPHSVASHREIGEMAAALGLDELVVVGAAAAEIALAAEAAGLPVRFVNTAAEAAEFLVDYAQPGDLVLVKGSRAARMERVLEEFGRRQSAIGAVR